MATWVIDRLLKLYPEKLSSFISLEHRLNVACVSVFYCYYNGFCSGELENFTSWIYDFLRRAHLFVVDWPIEWIIQYRENTFFIRTIRKWNALSSVDFPATYDINKFKCKIHRHHTLLPALTYFPKINAMHCRTDLI